MQTDRETGERQVRDRQADRQTDRQVRDRQTGVSPPLPLQMSTVTLTCSDPPLQPSPVVPLPCSPHLVRDVVAALQQQVSQSVRPQQEVNDLIQQRGGLDQSDDSREERGSRECSSFILPTISSPSWALRERSSPSDSWREASSSRAS
ncbi:hypothetical protein F7725_010847 [Dissostichus mawsoni]|uniref:Uncharacterized protein n=1 Tax=Dissostichus mawsoni TaxID=36200 RepID=A0A7J5Z7L2_DISMA|nr:hypothetical protein F7725_010847 [Dissostichus mawsoni]